MYLNIYCPCCGERLRKLPGYEDDYKDNPILHYSCCVDDAAKKTHDFFVYTKDVTPSKTVMVIVGV